MRAVIFLCSSRQTPKVLLFGTCGRASQKRAFRAKNSCDITGGSVACSRVGGEWGRLLLFLSLAGAVSASKILSNLQKKVLQLA